MWTSVEVQGVDVETNRANLIRNHFMGWQCRIRQHVMRYGGGRPSDGMRPQLLGAGGEDLGQVIVLINKRDAEPVAQQFRHMVLKTQDPNERYDSAMTHFAAAYYQRGHEFDESLTALFGPDSALAGKLIDDGRCQLRFDEFNQRYALDCAVSDLEQHDMRYQVTYWHNRLFNPAMPAGVKILALTPNWSQVEADPPAL